MARARLPSGERLLVALIAVITFAVVLQLWNLLYEGSDAGITHTRANLHKHKGRYVVPASFNVSLDERSDFGGMVEYIGDDAASPQSDSSVEFITSHSDDDGHDHYDRSSQKDDGSEGKDKAFQTANWKKCTERGSELIGLLSKASIFKDEESQFKDYGDLKKYGWEVSEKRYDPTDHDDMLLELLQTLKIPYGPKVSHEKWHLLDIGHSLATKGPDGQTYPATGGNFQMTHDPKDEIIIGENFKSPAHAPGGMSLTPNQMTPLRFVSDIIYLTWAQKCQQDKTPPANLKYYVASNIVNKETRSAVREAVGGFLVTNLPAWPGVHYTKGKDDVKLAGLIGTPVGSSIGRLLVQRKSTMGLDRGIVGIRVWKEDPGDDDWFIDHGPIMMMVFELSDPHSDSRAGPSRTQARRSRLDPRDPTKHQPLIPSILSQVSSGASAATSLATKVKSEAPTAASAISDLFSEVQVEVPTALSAISGCFSDVPLEVELPTAVSGISGSSRARRSLLEPRKADPWHKIPMPPTLNSTSSAASVASSLATKVKGAAPTAVSAISSLVGEVENEAPTAISAIPGCLSNAPLEFEAPTAVSGTPDPSYTRRSRLEPRDPNFLDDLISIGTHIVGEFLGDEPTPTSTPTDLSAILSLLSNPLVQAAEPTVVPAISSVFGSIRNGRHGAPTAVSAISGLFSNTALQIQAPTAVAGIPGCFGNKTGVSAALKGQESAVAASVASGLLSSATGSSEAELKVRQTTQTDCRTPQKSRVRPRAVNDYWGSPVSRPQSVPDNDRFGDRVYMAGQWMFSWMAVFGR